MKIHLRQVPAEGLHLEGEEACPIHDLEDEEIRCAGPLRYALDFGISEGALWANGTLWQAVELPCVACLERFVHTIEIPAFALHLELSGPETIDFTPFLREDILLNLPSYPRCDRAGGRVCPGPALGALAENGPRDDPSKRQPDWSALDKLDL